MKTLYELFCESCAAQPSSLAIVEKEISLSYAALKIKVQETVNNLVFRGVVQGNRLLVVDGSPLELTILEIAASYLGITLVYLEGMDKGSDWELNRIINDVHIDRTIGTEPLSDKATMHILLGGEQTFQKTDLAPAKSTSEHILVQCYTSGSTGEPKGVCLTESGLVWQGRQVAEAMELHDNAKLLLESSVTDMVGQLLMIASISSRSQLIVEKIKPEDTFRFVEKHRITHLMLPPFYLAQALKDPDLEYKDLSSIELIAYGCAPIADHLLARARSTLNCSWLQGYGLTETSGPFCWLTDIQHSLGLGTVGQPANGVFVEIRSSNGVVLREGEEGEIWVKSPANMAGYWSTDTTSVEKSPKIIDGWIQTGDRGVLDTFGFLSLKGRLDDVIKLGDGVTVYPAEIEKLLEDVTGVIELSIAGMRDKEEHGSVPILFLYTDENKKDVLSEVRSKINKNLNPLKHPKYVVFCRNKLERSKNGKVIKKKLFNQLDDVSTFLFEDNKDLEVLK